MTSEQNAGSRASIVANLPPVTDPAGILAAALCSPRMHLAYITNDTGAAIRHFESLGIGPWSTNEVPLRGEGLPEDAVVLGSFARMTGRMYEIVEPMVDAPPIYPRPSAEHLSIVFHHVGTFMETDPDSVIDVAQSAGLDWDRRGANGDVVFVDTRDKMGHWLEVLCFAGGSGTATENRKP